MKSILQLWVTNLGLRHQGVLLTGIRGCDGMAKEDSTKPLARELRGLILVPFDKRELLYERGFMTGFPSNAAKESFKQLMKSLDHYPVHYLFHLIHAVEVVGYHHPRFLVRKTYLARYVSFVQCLHLSPESKAQMDNRLTEDRIRKGTVE